MLGKTKKKVVRKKTTRKVDLKKITPNSWINVTIMVAVIFIFSATFLFFIFYQGDNLEPAKDATDTDTSAWQTYENITYHYSFKHPASWQLGEDTKQLWEKELATGLPFLNRAKVFGIDGGSLSINGLYLSFYIFGNVTPENSDGDQCVGLKECVDEYIQSSIVGTPGWEIGKQQETELAGYQAIIQRVDRPEAGWSHLYTFVSTERNLLLIRFTTNYNKFDQAKKEFDKVISTFRFE